MLTQICQWIKNWFDIRADHTPYGHYSGTISISNSVISIDGEVLEIPTDHFRLIDSFKNNGVHAVSDKLKDETFNGSLWLMVIPERVVALAAEMTQWQTDYGSASKAPFLSESHKGYSYTKASSGSGSTASSSALEAFESELNAWRKI